MLAWTGAIGAAVLGSTLIGWLLLRTVEETFLALLMAIGAGGMFYLTITKLLPEAEERQYQQSAGLATTAGFLLIFALAKL